ncbi:hypothetical protein N9060_00275 [Arenicella sp.]|nr:hypothetical protein [Arenicella sp.]
MSIFKRLDAVFVLLILVISNPAFAEDVASMSSEVLKDVSADELYWVVEVTCVDAQGVRPIQQRAGESSWCAIDLPDLCEANKRTLADRICEQQYQALERSEETNLTVADPIVITTAPADSQANSPIQSTPEPSKVVESVAIEPARPEVSPASSSESSTTIMSPSNIIANQTIPDNRSQISVEEIRIEQELIQIEEQMLELRLREIELEQ